LMFSGVFAAAGGLTALQSVLVDSQLGSWGSLLLILFVTFIAGFVIDLITIMLILVPLAMPIIKSFGFDPLWFSITLLIMMQTSMSDTTDGRCDILFPRNCTAGNYAARHVSRRYTVRRVTLRGARAAIRVSVAGSLAADRALGQMTCFWRCRKSDQFPTAVSWSANNVPFVCCTFAISRTSPVARFTVKLFPETRPSSRVAIILIWSSFAAMGFSAKSSRPSA
jgi:hypothetical protein